MNLPEYSIRNAKVVWFFLAALFDIKLVDHIIIADGASYSFRQYGQLQ